MWCFRIEITLSLEWAWSRSRDVFKFWEISDNISEMLQDKDIQFITKWGLLCEINCGYSYSGRQIWNYALRIKWMIANNFEWVWSPLWLFETFVISTLCLKKNDNDVLRYKFNAHQPILIIFGRDIAEWICLSLIHIWRCRRSYACRSRWSPYH